jgi:hypothetical protein
MKWLNASPGLYGPTEVNPYHVIAVTPYGKDGKMTEVTTAARKFVVQGSLEEVKQIVDENYWGGTLDLETSEGIKE